MINLQFVLAVAGLTLIVVKSKLFAKPRTYFTLLYEKQKKLKKRIKIVWFIDSIFNCYMCFSLWGGLMLYPLRNVEIVMYVLNGVIITTLIIDLWQFLTRK